MSTSTSNSVRVSLPIFGLLGVAFVVLKLCGVIHWSWWWVTAPFWGPWALVLLILIAMGIFLVGGFFFCLIADAISSANYKRAMQRHAASEKQAKGRIIKTS